MSATSGATMLGEGRGIEDAARRGREKRRLREEQARAAAENDSLSGTTRCTQQGNAGTGSGTGNEEKVNWESEKAHQQSGDKDTARPQKSVRNWIREYILLEAPR